MITSRTQPHPALLLCASMGLWALACTTATGAQADRYRIDVIVFEHLDGASTPAQEQMLERFGNLYELDSGAMPAAPQRLRLEDGEFEAIWQRLERLAAYQPLTRLSYEQTVYDYHPAVRLHNEVVLAYAPDAPNRPTAALETDMPAVATRDAAEAAALSERTEAVPSAVPLYQLDGSIQLRRSRFLHVDLDLEYRLDGPAWALAFPDQQALKPGFSWVGEAPEAASGDGFEEEPLETAPVTPIPFELHRLRQSRQIKSNTLQYFDSAFLGAIVRVSTISAAAP